MTDITFLLSAELTEIGLMAAADPHFAERLIEALRRLPEHAAGVCVSATVDGSAAVDAPQPDAPARQLQQSAQGSGNPAAHGLDDEVADHRVPRRIDVLAGR